MVFSYVRDLVEDVTGNPADTNADGDLFADFDGNRLRARIVYPADPVVQLSTVSVDGLEPTLELFSAINDINSEIGFARAYWVPNKLIIESEIWASDVNPANFEFSIINVTRTTAQHAPHIIDTFGGRRPPCPVDGQLQLESLTEASTTAGGYL